MKVKQWIISFIVFILLPIHASAISILKFPKEEDLPTFLNRLFEARTQMLINEEPDTIAEFYRNTRQSSRFTFLQEVQRVKYINTWATFRGVDFTKSENKIRLVNATIKGDRARVFLIHTLKLTYEYPNPNLAPQSFGVGSRHMITLKKSNGSWYVSEEWYTDPIEEDPNTIPANSVQGFPNRNIDPSINKTEMETTQQTSKKYLRDKAVA